MTEHVRIIADFTDGLMQMDADGQPVPAIAESYDLSEDGTVYTSSVNADGLHEISLKVYCPQLAGYGDAIAYTDLVLTQVVLTVD